MKLNYGLDQCNKIVETKLINKLRGIAATSLEEQINKLQMYFRHRHGYKREKKYSASPTFQFMWNLYAWLLRGAYNEHNPAAAHLQFNHS